MPVGIFFSQKLPAGARARFDALAALGFRPVYTAWQEHGTDIVRLRAPFVHPGVDRLIESQPRGDILVTDQPGLWIGVKTADCVPVLLWDDGAGVAAAVHAGWRGTARNAVGAAVRVMAEEFGAHPGRMRAAMGPCICRDCFETRADVPAALPERMAAYVRDRGDGRFLVDLPAVNAALLREAGVEDLALPAACTCCRPDLYWSHRRHGGARGLQVSLIRLEEGRKPD